MELVNNTDNSKQKRMEEAIKYMVEKTVSENGIEIIKLMKLEFVECNAEEKTLTTKIRVVDWELNPQGTMHGGLVATVFDTTFGLLTHYYAGQNFITTVDLSTRYLKAIPSNCNLLIKVKACHVGRTLASLTGEAFIEESGVLASVCNSTFMIVRGKQAQIKPPGI